MRAFVTGGTGFVGAHLVRALLARGDQVACLVRNPAKAEALGWTGRVRVLRGDLSATDALRAGCRDAEIVYHVAGSISARHATEFMALNRDTTAGVLEAAQEHPPRRFVYISSQAAGGPSPRGRPVDETHPPSPITHYGRSKLAGELLVRAMPFPWTIVRPPAVYGEWDREFLKVFRAARTGFAPVFGDGSQELSLIYAPDLARALLAAGTSPAAERKLYYAAHPDSTTSGDLVRAIGRAVGKEVRLIPIPPLLARGALWAIGGVAGLLGRATVLSADKADEFLAPAWTCRPDALMRDTGWTAEIPLQDGLRRTAAWYRERGWL
ncbi:MAG: NAD-dependent epimerase/dehydratase family protein [Gemmatimonadales bacterium]